MTPTLPTSESTDRNTHRSLIVILFAKVAGFVSTLFLARWAAHEEAFGEYAFWLSIMLMLAVVAALGIPVAMMRFLAPGLARGDDEGLRRIRRHANQIVGMGVLGVLGVAIPVAVWTQGGLQDTAAWSLAAIPSLVARWMLETHAKVQHRPVLAVGPGLILQPVLQMLGIGFLAWRGGRGAEASELLMAYFLANLAATGCLGCWLILGKNRRPRLDRSETIETFNATVASRVQLLRVGGPILLVGCLAVLMGQIDVVMLRNMAGQGETGIYFASVQLAAVLSLPLVAVNILAGARYAALWNTNQRETFRGLAGHYGRFLMRWSVPLYLLLALGGWWFLGWHGPAYRAGFVALQILLLGQVVNAFVGSTALILNMTGHENRVALIFAVCCTLNITGNALLIPRVGIEGAALVSTGCLALWNLWLWGLVKHHLGADTSWLARTP